MALRTVPWGETRTKMGQDIYGTMSEKWGGKERVVGFIDVGTNSARLLIVRINANRSYTVLRQEKEVVRLGEGEFNRRRLMPLAIERTLVVCRKFAELSHNFGAEDVIAVATSAAREARNQQELLDRMRAEARIELSVISGKEEARLIYLGVSSGLNLGDRETLFIDIGGGSCEIVIGDQNKYHYLDSLKLGALRMTTLFLPEEHIGPVPDKTYERMCNHVRTAMIRTKNEVADHDIHQVVASSGTANNLAQIAARMYGLDEEGPLSLSRAHLHKVSAHLRSLDLEERGRVPGINPERADIIVGGAATLETIMDELDIDRVNVSDRGLRDGLLMEYLARIGISVDPSNINIRERSVLQLARSCDVDEQHARTVQRLAMGLFDSAREMRLHGLGDMERESLYHAAMLHDIGDFISFNNHHRHSFYIISNSELLGFDQREVAIIAGIARYHRKKTPSRNDPEMRSLDPDAQRSIIILSSLLRIAESLDRSHMGLIDFAGFKVGHDGPVLLIRSQKECQLECWGVESDGRAFQKAFGTALAVDLQQIEPAVNLTLYANEGLTSGVPGTDPL